MRPLRRGNRVAVFVVALTAGLVLAACGGDPEEPADESPDAQSVTSGTELTQTWPLTGLPVTGDDTAGQSHPVLVVKMDNTGGSAPQQGLDKADLVVEELVEGGVTRLAAFFYSAIPTETGPVRSMRASDIGIVAPVGATMVTSGAAAVTLERISGAGIPYFSEGSPGFYRDSGRRAPYNLMTDLAETAKAADLGKEVTPDDYLSWGTSEDLPRGQKAKVIQASFSGGHTTYWRYKGGGYVNENSNADRDQPFPTDTVLVLRVQVGDAGYKDPAGNFVPETILEGTGEAMLFHGGRLVRATWSKASLDAPIELSTVAGELKIPAGHTWIELVPADGGEVTFAKK